MQAAGLVLPPPLRPPGGLVFPFQFVRVVGRRALISGHGPQNADGSIVATLGKVGREVTPEQGYVAARLTALSILGSLERALGDLDRIAAWTRLFGMVLGAWLQPPAWRHQRLLRPDTRVVRPRSRRTQSQRSGHG